MWRVHTRWLAGITALVMLLAALAPTVSHALARAGAPAPASLDLCTVAPAPGQAAAHPAPMPADASSGQEESAPSLIHCPFCLPIADRLGPPPAASLHFFNADSGLAPPDAQAPFFAHPVTAATLPRGPPSHA
jgi:hypothetical protein